MKHYLSRAKGKENMLRKYTKVPQMANSYYNADMRPEKFNPDLTDMENWTHVGTGVPRGATDMMRSRARLQEYMKSG